MRTKALFLGAMALVAVLGGSARGASLTHVPGGAVRPN